MEDPIRYFFVLSFPLLGEKSPPDNLVLLFESGSVP